MKIWQQKQEESKSIWFRVPASLKKEFEELRQQAEAEGLDAGATFTAALGRPAKQLREELPHSRVPANEPSRQSKTNGLNHHENGRSIRAAAEG
jgi:hypothetical protein